MADPTQRVKSAGGKSNSPVLTEPFDHLIQHIKHPDPMLYEALRKMGLSITNLGSVTNKTIEQQAQQVVQQDKCTFGLVKTLVVGTGLTLDYIVRKAGTFVDWTAKITTQAPTGSAAILDVLRSPDDGTSWASIFSTSAKITLPAGSTKLVTVKTFAISNVSMGDLLRIDCLQIGSTDPGKGIEIVGRWTA